MPSGVEVKRRKGTTVEHASFTGALAEISIDTDKKTTVVHDGSTAGGFPQALESHNHKLDDLLAPDDNTDLNASTTKHGLLRKLDNDTTHFLNGQGSWVRPGNLIGSATLDFPSTLANSYSDLTITITGAADGDPVSLGVPNASMTADGIFFAWVSATNTVTVRFCNLGLVTARDPASGTFKVIVHKL